MTSTPTPSLRVEIPAAGDYRGIWDQVMARILNHFDVAIAGATSIATTGGTTTLDDAQYVDNQTRSSTLVVTGALGSDAIIVVPARSKLYKIINKTTGNYDVFIRASDGASMLCPGQGSAGEVRIASDKSIVRLGPYVNFTTGAITSSRYAFLSELADENARAVAEEATLAKLDGSRAFANPVSGATPTANSHLATKLYVDGVAGINDASFATTGSASAYVVTTGIDLTLSDGLTISFRPHVTNNEGCTLNIDGKGAKPLRGISSKALLAGVAIQGTPYRARYVSSSQEWLFLGYFDSPYNIPLGGFLDYVVAAAPNSYFAMPFGQAISRTTYAALWNLIGTQFGPGNGTTTFNLPDLRGRTVVGLDNMGGNAASRVTNAKSGIDGLTVGAFGGNEVVTLARANLPNVKLSGTTSAAGAHTHQYADRNPFGGGGGVASGSNLGVGNDISRTTESAGNHTHPFETESMNGGGSQTDVNKMPPSIVLPKLLRVI